MLPHWLWPFTCSITPNLITPKMRDRRDRASMPNAPQALPAAKRLGSYLVEAGLITPAQVDVALNDQKMMDDLRFGEALVTRGWIKQQTLDYLIKKIVEPEQQALRQVKSPSPAPAANQGLKGYPDREKNTLPPAPATHHQPPEPAPPRLLAPPLVDVNVNVGWVG
jgi:hypothetical protein